MSLKGVPFQIVKKGVRLYKFGFFNVAFQDFNAARRYMAARLGGLRRDASLARSFYRWAFVSAGAVRASLFDSFLTHPRRLWKGARFQMVKTCN